MDCGQDPRGNWIARSFNCITIVDADRSLIACVPVDPDIENAVFVLLDTLFGDVAVALYYA